MRTPILAAVLLAITASAQAPAKVPADAFGPPDCGGRKIPPLTMIETAHGEQHAGAEDPSALPSAEPLENFAISRMRLLAYGECSEKSACYWADLDAQYRRAEAALRMQAAAHHGEKLAIVMDIDETTLSNYCEMKREDFGYVASVYGPWEVSPEAAVAIPGALRLFHEAAEAGVKVFFITGRPGKPSAGKVGGDETEATSRNLRAAGFDGWAGLALRTGEEIGMPTIAYKSSERRKVETQGYRIVLSVGDQWSDLEGESKAEVSVKLPNPFYFIP